MVKQNKNSAESSGSFFSCFADATTDCLGFDSQDDVVSYSQQQTNYGHSRIGRLSNDSSGLANCGSVGQLYYSKLAEIARNSEVLRI